ncbi:MAG: MFS transporter [Thermoleophilaceae bacterium]|nr:MFS transporter [Thermoleophilaceae bacterium]
MSTVLSTRATERRGPHYLVTLTLLVTAGVSFAFMQTLVVPALPFFQREFDTTASWVAWIATGFLLSSSVLTPILGKLGDTYGKKRLLVISMAVFGLASVAAAFSTSLAMIVFFRVVQGAGAAVFPLAFGIIRDEFPPERVGIGIGTMSSVFGLGGGIGLVSSGAILQALSWPWLFLIGAVPALAVAALIAWIVPESRTRIQSRPDWLGGATLSLALVGLLLAVSEGNAWGWLSPGVLGLFAASGALFALWVRIERRVPDPMVDLASLSSRPMAVTNATTVLIGFAMFGSFILLPGFVQAPGDVPAQVAEQVTYGFDASPVMTGLFFLPSSLAMLLAGPLAGAAGTRFGAAWPLRFGLASIALGVFLIAFFHDAPWMIFVFMMFHGIGVAAALSAVGNLVVENVSAADTGVASGMNSIMRTTGAAFGAQISSAVVTAYAIPSTTVPLEAGYTIALAISASAALFGLALTTLLSPPGGRMRGLQRRRVAVRA